MDIGRIVGNILLLIGHTILLYYSPTLGISIKLGGSILLLLYFNSIKLYDMSITIAAFSSLELIRLLIYLM